METSTSPKFLDSLTTGQGGTSSCKDSSQKTKEELNLIKDLLVVIQAKSTQLNALLVELCACLFSEAADDEKVEEMREIFFKHRASGAFVSKKILDTHSS